MSSIQSVQGSGASALAAQVAPKPQPAKPETAAQEAQETVAVTKAEARKGDQQAIRKMARSQPASKPQEAESVEATPPGRVNVIA